MKRIILLIERLWNITFDTLNVILMKTSRKVLVNNFRNKNYQIKSDSEHLENAILWLVHAQDISEGRGVSGGYSLIRGWSPPYPETTGYIIPTFLKYATFTDNNTYVQKAINMGDWEIELQLPNGAVRGGVGFKGKPIVFNTGQVILGWIALYNHTKQIRFLDAAIKAANWLVSIQNEDGSWTKDTYMSIAHAYHSRVAWPLLEVYKLTGDLKYKKAATKNIFYVLSRVRDNSWIDEMGFHHDQDPLTHTIAYTLRGLLESSEFLDKKNQKKINEIVENAANKIMLAYELRKVHPYAMPQYLSATFNNRWKSTANYSCLTGNAQIAIIWMKLYQKNNDARLLNAAMKAIDQLKQRQDIETFNKNIKGAIPGSYPIWGHYMKYFYPNWATKFFADAIMLQEEILSNLEAN